ncbi:MAG: TonB-dependent receptor [Polaribacter sp.]
MKKITIFLFLFVSTLANAQTFTLSGKIVDENKKPLPGATIFVKEVKKGTSADFKGNFSIKLLKGTYTIQASFLGYKTISKKISINKNEEYTIQLHPNTTLLEEVLVSAVRVNATVPVTFSNLSKREITKRNLGQDIPVLLNYMPSVVSSSDAGAGVGYTQMSVRGSNGERINVTINGIPYNDPESHGSFWVNLGDFASSTQNLQLQRGVGTSTNGSGAFGASLNILTDAVSKNAYGEISNSFGSFNTRKHTVKFSTGKLNNSIEIAGRLSKIYSDGYVDRAFSDLKSYYLQASYTDKNTLIKAITFGGKERTYQAWGGLTATQLKENRIQNPYTYDNEIDNYNQNHYQLHWNEKINKNWSTNLALNYTKGLGYFEQFKKEEDATTFGGIVEATDGKGKTDLIVRRWLDNNFQVINFNTNYKTEKLNFISGISYSKYTGDHFGEVIWAKKLSANANIRDRYYFSDAKKTDFSAFAKATFDVTEKLGAYVDLQGRFVNYKTKGMTSKIVPINVNADFNFFNPKFGFTYRMNRNNNLYTSFAVANREPNRNDFKNGVTTYETLNDYEFGWRLKSETIKLNANVYYMKYKNQLVLTGALNDVGAPIRASSGNSYRLGLEMDATITLSEQLSLKPNAAISKNKNKNFFIEEKGIAKSLGNTNLSYSPDVILGNILLYKPLDNLQFSFLSKYVGKQFLNNIDDKNSQLDSYFTSDFNLVYQLKPTKIFKSIIFTGLINNVFNKKYVSNAVDYGGGYIYYYPQATINFLVGVTLKF